MDKNECKRGIKEPKKHTITIRISDSLRVWLDHNHISPTKLFYAAAVRLGYRQR